MQGINVVSRPVISRQKRNQFAIYTGPCAQKGVQHLGIFNGAQNLPQITAHTDAFVIVRVSIISILMIWWKKRKET